MFAIAPFSFKFLSCLPSAVLAAEFLHLLPACVRSSDRDRTARGSADDFIHLCPGTSTLWASADSTL
jgi:hypothetical protein